ncbi:MAG: T9SS type A sorting domain-containing protein [Rhodothermaceae bacterium]|nr:T9SS type A sorting domain-containing protein [Rhodothermaceae bacterium]MYE63621.1 T9SS type A sorting domain-containing protein [Rhodothermaceae bacterium]
MVCYTSPKFTIGIQMQNLIYCFTLMVMFIFTGTTTAQQIDFEWLPSPTLELGTIDADDIPAYALGIQRGAPSIAGPTDLDNDGKIEVILSDYSGGGRVHVLESAGVDTWELIYSSPTLIRSSGTTENARGVGFGDLDGDDLGEIYVFLGYGIEDADPPIREIIPGPRLVVIEAVADNLFARIPNVWNFDGSVPDRFLTEQITTADVDADGIEELLFGNNGSNNIYDSWYVVTAQDLGTPLATFTQEARWTSRSDSVDSVNRGGGSPFGIVPADFDGDGSYELALTSWNNLNFTNLDVTGADTYIDPSGENAFYMASEFDDVSYFGCTVVDMDMNNDDEVYCPSWDFSIALINYEDGENPLEITSDNVVYPLKGFPSSREINYWGLTNGDIDQDGVPELIGSGDPYTPQDYQKGGIPKWVRIWDYDGEGDVEDPSSYRIREVEFPMPMGMIFDTVNRDSAGVKSMYHTTTYADDQLGTGGLFAGKFAYLGDADNDGHNEVAMSISGVPDSVYVYSEVWSAADSTYNRITTSAVPHPHRVFLKVLSGDGISTRISDERVILPADFELHSNYPNPFNPSTNFSFTLPLNKRVSVRVYDMTGRLVRTLVNDEAYVQGTHTVNWNGLNDGGSAVASGQYIYTLEWGQFRQARRMVLVK